MKRGNGLGGTCRYLLERNTDHLRQATTDGTPFATGPLKDFFGLYGTNENADTVLAGTFDIDALPLSIEGKSWLHKMTYDDSEVPTPVDLNFTDDDFKSAVKGCNEKTSASSSGLGYVIWKACGRSPAAS